MTVYAQIRWATWNTPESMKRGLVKDRIRRAALVFRWLIANGVTGANTQESGTYQGAEAKRRRRMWRAWHTVNDIVKGRRIGNGVVWRWALLKALDRNTIDVAGELGLPVTLFKHRATGAVFANIGVHNRTRRDDPHNRIRPETIYQIRRYCAQLRAARIPFIVAGDFNDGHNPIPELLRASQHKVDWILTSRDIITISAHTDHEPLLSDHAVTYADLRIPVTKGAIKHLPKEPA